MDWSYLGSRGASGGIFLMWDRRVGKKIEDCVGNVMVACSFRSVSDSFEWDFVGVYGPNDDVCMQTYYMFCTLLCVVHTG
jgi:hypothetical protein